MGRTGFSARLKELGPIGVLPFLVPVVVLLAGLAVMGVGAALLADENRSAGVFPGRVLAVYVPGRHWVADVEFTGPDGRVTRATVEKGKGRLQPGSEVSVRVWPGERRAALDHGASREATIVVGGVVTLLGAGAGVVNVVRARRARS